MRLLYLVFASLLFVQCESGRSNAHKRLVRDFVELHAIDILLDRAKPSELKNHNLGVIIFYNTQDFWFDPFCIAGDIIAWFKYNYDDEYIAVNYFLFPDKSTLYNLPDFFGSGIQLDVFLEEIILNEQVVLAENSGQLTIPLPVGLQNDSLFKRTPKLKMDSIVLIDSAHSYYAGFRSNKHKWFYESRSSQGMFFLEIRDKILKPITTHIYCHETPEKRRGEWEQYAIKHNLDINALK